MRRLHPPLLLNSEHSYWMDYLRSSTQPPRLRVTKETSVQMFKNCSSPNMHPQRMKSPSEGDENDQSRKPQGRGACAHVLRRSTFSRVSCPVPQYAHTAQHCKICWYYGMCVITGPSDRTTSPEPSCREHSSQLLGLAQECWGESSAHFCSLLSLAAMHVMESVPSHMSVGY